MEITINNKILCRDAPETLQAEMKNRLSFINPKWIENDRRGYWNGETPRTLKFYESDNGALILPRGYAKQLISLCRREDVPFHIEDNRRTLSNVNFTFKGTLRPFQEIAVKDILSHDFGTFSAPTGSGKTVIALYVISQRKQPSLIVVHTKELLNQWIDRIETFLQIPAEEVGVIGNGQKEIGSKITVALVQTLYKCAEEVAPYIGYLIVDEVHRAPARCFSEAITAFDSRFMTGLSATPYRRDGLSRLIYWHLGDVVHEIQAEQLVKSKDILKAEVVTRETDFQTSYNASEEYSKVLSELTMDPDRNKLIVRDVVKEANNGGGTCLVLSDRKQHCETFKVLLRGHGIHADVLTGDINGKEREKIVERLNNGQVKVLVATGALIGEGFDCPGLSTLFLVTPVRFSGRVIQYLGRVLRPAPGKEQAVVYDYVDSKVGVLKASAKSRQAVYNSPAR